MLSLTWKSMVLAFNMELSTLRRLHGHSMLFVFHVHPMLSVNMKFPRWERQQGSLHVSTEQGNSMLNIIHDQG